MKTLNGKITFFGIAICVLTGLIIGAFSFLQSRDYLTASKIKENKNNVNIFAESIQSRISELKSDVKFLSSTPPVRGILRAARNKGIDSKDGSSSKIWKDRLATIFKEMLYAKSNYVQIRYVGTKDGGREILRVERQGIKVFRTTENNLQKKSEEPYFQEAIKTDPNRVYLSPFSLNREFGKVTYPLQMVLRAAVPIYETQGKPFGFIIINVDYTSIFRGLEHFTGDGVEYFILNDQDQVLLNSRNEYDPFSHSDDNLAPIDSTPSLSLFHDLKKLDRDKDSYFTTIELFDNQDVYVFKKVRYNDMNPGEFLAIFLKLNKSTLMAEVKSDLINIVFLLLLLVTFAVLISFGFSRKIVSPIQHLMKLTQRISAGAHIDFSETNVDSQDEIGTLTHTLLDMSKDILKKNYQLESQQKALDSFAIVAETDLRGKITYINDKFIDISKYSQDELIGKDHRIINSGYHPKEFFEEMWKNISNGRIWRGEIRNRAKDGSIYWVDTTIYPITDETNKLQKFVAIRYDVTERKKFEEELTIASEKTKKAMEVKSNFLANMSHEIRTPLNSVIGLADVLTETKLDKEQRKYLSALKASGDSLLQIVNDILDLSKIEAGQLEIESIEFDVEALTEEIIEIMSVKAQKKKVELVMDFDFNIPNLIYGDSLRLRQVLINLIGNAIKFTSKGHVSLAVSLLRKDTISEVAEVEFKILDTGIGIDKENLGKIFESFSQADTSITRQFGGTGLGLNIVKQLVEKMNGNIDVQSQENKGSVFRVTLPFRYNSTCLIKKSDVQYLIKDKSVLVVDDFQENRLVLTKMLEYWGAHVDEADGGKKALKRVLSKHENGESYDLILLDSRMPDLDGFEVIDELKERNLFDDSLIMVLTSDHRSGDLAKVKELGVGAYLIKPVKKSDLELTIKNVSKVRNRGKLLIVDDEETLLAAVQDLLISLNLEVHIAQNAKEAMSLVQSVDFDAVVSDYGLPKKNGIDFIREARAIGVDIPIAILSGYVDKKMKLEKEALGIFDFIEKPYDSEQFSKTIGKMIHEGKDIKRKRNTPEGAADGPLKILVADDSADNRNLMEVYFKDESHIVSFVENGQEAVRTLETNKYDLVFMDMQMPIMDGYEATQKIRHWEAAHGKKKTPIVALTANAMKEEREKTLNVGCTDYLTKPIKKNQLLEFINKNYRKAS